MDKLESMWASLRQIVTSRTMWGVFVMLLGLVGIHPAAGLDAAIASVGDSLVAFAGAVLALIGYVDRRPKPGMIEVPAVR